MDPEVDGGVGVRGAPVRHLGSTRELATGAVAGLVGTAAYTVTSMALTPGGGRPVSRDPGARDRPLADLAVHWGYGALQGVVAVGLRRRLPEPAAMAAHLVLAVAPWWLAQRVADGARPARPLRDLVKHGVYVVVTALSIQQLGHRPYPR